MGQSSFGIWGNSRPAATTDNTKLMATLDMINRKMVKGTIKIASDGISHSWHIKTENKSPAYTTRWGELPVVR